MNTSRTNSAAPAIDAADQREQTQRCARKESPLEIPKRWRGHYATLGDARTRLLKRRSEALSEAAEPMERSTLNLADSASDEFDHELALSQLSAEQDALHEVEAAMQRILDGSFGVCEQTGKRIPAARLRAVPWTRFCQEVEADRERAGEVSRPRLGTLRSVAP